MDAKHKRTTNYAHFDGLDYDITQRVNATTTIIFTFDSYANFCSSYFFFTCDCVEVELCSWYNIPRPPAIDKENLWCGRFCVARILGTNSKIRGTSAFVYEFDVCYCDHEFHGDDKMMRQLGLSEMFDGKLVTSFWFLSVFGNRRSTWVSEWVTGEGLLLFILLIVVSKMIQRPRDKEIVLLPSFSLPG